MLLRLNRGRERKREIAERSRFHSFREAEHGDEAR